MKGSCRVSASAALHEGWSSSFLVLLRISGYNSATVGRRSFFFLLAEFLGCPRTNCPLDALLPRSSQYSTREFKTHLSIARRAFRVSTQPVSVGAWIGVRHELTALLVVGCVRNPPP